MKKFLIGLAVAAISVTGLSVNTANAEGNDLPKTKIVNIDCSTSKWKLHYLFGVKDREDLVEGAHELYASVYTYLAADEDGIVNIFGQNMTVTLTGDKNGGTITLTDEGVTVLTASLTDGEFSFDASAKVGDYLSINVSFFKDRLGNLCGHEPFTVCLNNTTFLVEAADLKVYLADNETAVVVSAKVGCAGAPGKDGSNGSNGSNGSTGATGAAGATGATGAAGPAGQTVVIEKTVTVQAPAPVVLPRTL